MRATDSRLSECDSNTVTSWERQDDGMWEQVVSGWG